MPEESALPVWQQAVGWTVMFLLGPIHFAGEMVGPAGGTDWRQWVCAFGGSLLWVWVALEVIELV